jgi:hypothetical protein
MRVWDRSWLNGAALRLRQLGSESDDGREPEDGAVTCREPDAGRASKPGFIPSGWAPACGELSLGCGKLPAGEGQHAACG